VSQGYRAYALRGGYMAWYQAGYPIERKTATAAMPLKRMCPECGSPVEEHPSQESA
jgi:hypothetical protein